MRDPTSGADKGSDTPTKFAARIARRSGSTRPTFEDAVVEAPAAPEGKVGAKMNTRSNGSSRGPGKMLTPSGALDARGRQRVTTSLSLEGVRPAGRLWATSHPILRPATRLRHAAPARWRGNAEGRVRTARSRGKHYKVSDKNPRNPTLQAHQNPQPKDVTALRAASNPGGGRPVSERLLAASRHGTKNRRSRDAGVRGHRIARSEIGVSPARP